ncbi:solute carrier family 2, facilitated glucose transporter member 9-like [Fundulus diaphanus]
MAATGACDRQGTNGNRGLGLSLHSMYLGEISPRKIRGRLTLTSATFASLGKLCGQFFGLSEILGRRDLWHILLCVPVCFSVAQVLVLPFLPEAPRYLFLEKGDDKACKRALQRLWGKGDYKQEVEEMLIEQTALEASPPKSPLQLLKDQTVRWQLITIFIIYFCNQMSGMSAISTFSFDIFLKAGVPKDKIRYVTLGLGVSEILTSISCDALSSYCFMLFAGVCLLGSLYTFFLLPETKGKTFMDISTEFKAITVCGKSFLEEDKVETKF